MGVGRKSGRSRSSRRLDCQSPFSPGSRCDDLRMDCVILTNTDTKQECYSFPMPSGSHNRRIVSILIVFLLSPSLSGTASAQAPPDTSDTECEESPPACLFGGVFALFAAPYTYPFSDLRATYDPGEMSVLGARVEHRFRTLGVSDERMHPYLGVGFLLAYERRESRTGLAWTGSRVTTNADVETALGYQWAAAPLLRPITPWNPPIVATTEVQWRPFRASSRFRAEVAPGLSLSLSSDRRLRIHVPISFPLGSMKRAGLRFGIGVVYNWK